MHPVETLEARSSEVGGFAPSVPASGLTSKVLYSSSRLVTPCLSPIVFPAGDELQWGEVGEGLVGAHAVVSVFPVAHPLMLRAIAAAKKKNDRIDAGKICDCLRCDFLPECYIAPTAIRQRRRTLRYRNLLVR